MGAMTGLFDDFFDKDFLDDASIRLLMDPNALEGKASNEKNCSVFFKTALDKAPDKTWFNQHWLQFTRHRLPVNYNPEGA